jgi:hypothetical protein
MRILVLLLFYSVTVISQDNLTSEQLTDLKKSILIDAIKYADKSDEEYKTYYLSDKWTLKLDIQKVKDTFHISNSKWIYFEVINEFEFETSGHRIKTVYIHGKPIYDNLNKHGLIALDEKNNLLYLGGGFMRSSLSHMFNLKEDDAAFDKYLKIKFYNYNLEKIKKVKETRQNLIFTAFSRTLMKEIRISANRKNFEDITIINKY